MSIIAITSPGDAPGATVTAFAMTMTWPAPVLLAECSPAGGKMLRGYYRCAIPTDRGLWNLALAAVKGPEAAEKQLPDQVVVLDDKRQRLLLPGLPNPFLSTELDRSTWETLAAGWAGLPYTVLADVGPIGPGQPFALLEAAELVVVVMRPTLAQVAAARPSLTRLRQALGKATPLALFLVGDGPYSRRDIRAQLGDFALTVDLPYSPKIARLLSEGEGGRWTRSRVDTCGLMLTARTAGRMITKLTAGRRVPANRTGRPAAADGGKR